MNRLRRLITEWAANERGQVALIVGLAMTVLMGTMGLILDGGLLFFDHRGVRNAADAAALAGANRMFVGADSGAALSPNNVPCTDSQRTTRAALDAACDFAEEHGYASSNILVSIPPIAGPFSGQSGYIRVEVARNRPPIFMRLFGFSSVTARGVATAGQVLGPPGAALYALSGNACPGMQMTSSGSLYVYGGGIQVNSNCAPPPAGDEAFDMSTGPYICVDDEFTSNDDGDSDTGIDDGCEGDGSINVVGPISCHPTLGCNADPDPVTGSGTANDPLQGLPGPAPESSPPWPGNAFSFCDNDPVAPGPDAIAAGSLLASDSRWTASPLVPASSPAVGTCPVGSMVLPTAQFSPGTAQTPVQYNVCADAPDPDGDGDRDLFAGIYWGGIRVSNCDVEFHPGVYVLSGQDSNSPNPRASIDLAAGPNDVISGGPMMVFITRDNFASSPNRRPSGPALFSTSGGSGGGVIDLNTGDPPTCPISGPSFQGLFLFYHRGDSNTPPPGGVGYCNDANSSTGGCSENEVRVQGGGRMIQLQGALYDRWGRLRANGTYTFSQTLLVFNVVDLAIQGTVVITSPCGTAPSPFIALVE